MPKLHLVKVDDPRRFGCVPTDADGRVTAFLEKTEQPPTDQINAADAKEVVFTFRNGSERKFSGQTLLLSFSVPQFFFHVTTAYDILRHCGVDIAKKDFLGTASQSVRD